jgi:hypothetical protein
MEPVRQFRPASTSAAACRVVAFPPDIAGKIRGAFDEDLNTVAALAVLHEVESGQDMPAGAKFETFAFVDRVLGLELAREIGHR